MEQLIKCVACGHEIARSAKVCPNCGKKNGKSRWKIVLIVIGVYAVIGGIVTVVLNSEDNEKSRAPAAQVSEKKPQSSGIWIVESSVDEFGDKTDYRYITTKGYIKGTFSNPVTQNSELDVDLAYSEKNGLVMRLYEYGSKLGMKATAVGMESITVAIQDGTGEKLTLSGRMAETWIYFNANDRETVKSILLAGNSIKFRISISSLGITSNYSFDIKNADGFDVAYHELLTKTES